MDWIYGFSLVLDLIFSPSGQLLKNAFVFSGAKYILWT